MTRQVVSSRWTFFLKLAFPLFWMIFMGGVCIIMLISPLEGIKEPFTPSIAKAMTIGFYLSTLGLTYLLFLRISWVAMSPDHLFVSNFFKSYKYTYNSIDRFEEKNMGIYKLIVIHFHQKTQFGNSIYFIRNHYWKYFLEKHPEVLETIFSKAEGDDGTLTETKQ